jgi:hypothetical protein
MRLPCQDQILSCCLCFMSLRAASLHKTTSLTTTPGSSAVSSPTAPFPPRPQETPWITSLDVPVLRQPKAGHRVIWGDQHVRVQQGYAASHRRRVPSPAPRRVLRFDASLPDDPSIARVKRTPPRHPLRTSHQTRQACTLPIEDWSLQLCSGSGQPGDNRFLLLAVCGRRARGNATVRENRHRIASV